MAAVGIDENELDRLRSRIGTQVSVSLEPYLTEATFDSIRHWSSALGDQNPLWRNADYARLWGFEDIVAPPTILFAFDRLALGYRGGLPGVHSFFGGTRFKWDGPLPRGTAVETTAVFKDLIERKSEFGGRSFQQLSQISFSDRKDNRTVAVAESWGMRVSRSEGKSRGKVMATAPPQYSRDDIAAIAAEYSREHVRTEPLLGGDVQVGEEVPSIIRGPYTMTNVVAFEQAWGGMFILSHGEWFEYLSRHPALGLNNAHGVPEPPEAVHWSDEIARSTGVPSAYDYGPERISWLGVLLTNWIGPTGLLTALDVQIRRFNLLGDLTRCRGVVKAIEARVDRSVVSLEVWAENQRGEKTAYGTAEVTLPRSSQQRAIELVGFVETSR